MCVRVGVTEYNGRNSVADLLCSFFFWLLEYYTLREINRMLNASHARRCGHQREKKLRNEKS